jgi:hypothetical protein
MKRPTREVVAAKCEICGKTEEDEFDVEIFHRGCRLKAAFPDSYKDIGGLLAFDPRKMLRELDSAKKKGREK